ncbi:MAG: Gfo/Idh/MocA family oxidoreductase [Geminicoccaceae bacterium]
MIKNTTTHVHGKGHLKMLNIAVIGAGTIGKIHAANVAASDQARLTHVCDLNHKAAIAVASEHESKAEQGLEWLVEGAVDGIIIASSTASHGDVAKACVPAKIPFLCEKPLAFDQATGLEILKAARSGGLVAGMAFNRRFDRQYAGMKAAIADGSIGDIETIQFTSRTASPPSVEFLKTSGGLFGEKGAHFYDLARWMTGEHPTEIVAMGSSLIDPEFAKAGETDTAMITMRMPSGILCQFSFSWRAAYGQDERIEVHGSWGMLLTEQAPIETFHRYSKSGSARGGLLPGWFERFEDSYKIELDHFLDAVQTGKPGNLPSLVDGLAAQQIADAAKKSVHEGTKISLEPMG